MPNIPPLPHSSRDGRCPWCKARLLKDSYDEYIGEDEEMAGHGRCKSCDAPIHVIFHEIITHEVEVRPERTKTDERYMAQMGIEEPKQHDF